MTTRIRLAQLENETALPTSKRAQSATKGKIGGKKPVRSPVGQGACPPVPRNPLLTSLPGEYALQPGLHPHRLSVECLSGAQRASKAALYHLKPALDDPR